MFAPVCAEESVCIKIMITWMLCLSIYIVFVYIYACAGEKGGGGWVAVFELSCCIET